MRRPPRAPATRLSIECRALGHRVLMEGKEALLWLGKADPVDTMKGARADHPSRQTMAALFSASRNAIGAEEGRTFSEIIKLACTTTSEDRGDDSVEDSVAICRTA